MAGLATLQGWRFQELVELPVRGMMQPSCPVFGAVLNSNENKGGGATRLLLSFMRTRDRARPLRGVGGYFWMQVSAVSLVHSSRPVNTGSPTFLLSIRSIMTDGAL